MWPPTRELLLKETVVIYLSASEEALCERLGEAHAAARPLLNVPGVDLPTLVSELLKRRGPIYEQAHYRVETTSHALEDVARAVVALRAAYE